LRAREVRPVATPLVARAEQARTPGPADARAPADRLLAPRARARVRVATRGDRGEAPRARPAVKPAEADRREAPRARPAVKLAEADRREVPRARPAVKLAEAAPRAAAAAVEMPARIT
jgi:hypothetical protein